MTNRIHTSLCLNTITSLAERESGAHGLLDDGLHQRVAALVEWINERGPYSHEQVEGMRTQIQHILANRLSIELDRRRFPGIADEEIKQPIFIIGFARSGTTLLHSLMAEDPAVQAPRSWHSHSPSPPPGAGPVCAGRMAKATRNVEAWMDFAPGVMQMHPYNDQGALQLIEDEELFCLDFRNAYPTILFRIPTLDVMDINFGDTEGTFRFHRPVLQHFQWNTGKTRWVCKQPSAQQNLEALLRVYPDALCVWAHRPLSEIYASNIAIRAATYDAINGRANDWSSQAMERARKLKAGVDRIMNNALIDDPRIVHVKFHELAADPVGTIKNIYRRGNMEVSTEFESGIRAWLDNPENRADRYGRYNYSYEAFGLDKAWIRELFADYSEYFGLVEKD